LIPSRNRSGSSVQRPGYGGAPSASHKSGFLSRRSSHSSRASKRRHNLPSIPSTTSVQDYDVNNPPSVPGSPVLGPDMGYDDFMLTGDVPSGRSADDKRSNRPSSRDALIEIDNDGQTNPYVESTPPSPPAVAQDLRRAPYSSAEIDVCFPQEGMSEIGHEDYLPRPEIANFRPRRRRKQWPDLSILEDWSREEKEERTMEGIRARKSREPLMIGGRLRPQKRVWHKEDDDAPYRFTYFNEEFENTIHSQTISELLGPGQTFRDLFIPDPPILSDSSSDEDNDDDAGSNVLGPTSSLNGYTSKVSTRHSSRAENQRHVSSEEGTGNNTPRQPATPRQSVTPSKPEKPPRVGQRPVFWLDVLSPTDAEMRVIAKAFGIHPLTAEDIMLQGKRFSLILQTI
jgi:magnesium transporter